MNCMIVDDEEMSRNAMRHLISQVEGLTLVRICNEPIEALNFLNTEKIDLIFLDVELPELNGLEFIKKLKKLPLVIFATSKKDYAIDAFEHNVVDYLVKPISINRFLKAIEKAKEIFNNIKQDVNFSSKDYIFIKSNSILLKIETKEILWIEALGDYTVINTATKKHVVHSTMKAVDEKLPPEIFIRVHRKYIIAIDKINSIEESTIVMDKKLIPVGAVFKDQLMKRLNLL